MRNRPPAAAAADVIRTVGVYITVPLLVLVVGFLQIFSTIVLYEERRVYTVSLITVQYSVRTVKQGMRQGRPTALGAVPARPVQYLHLYNVYTRMAYR